MGSKYSARQPEVIVSIKTNSKVLISRTSRRTLNQVKAADNEWNTRISLLQSAYKWAVSEASGYKKNSKIRKGREEVLPSDGPKPVIDSENFKDKKYSHMLFD